MDLTVPPSASLSGIAIMSVVPNYALKQLHETNRSSNLFTKIILH